MADSVFTKMLKGEIPREIIYQDDICFVIPTIAPHTEGHIMVIPIAQVANWEDLDRKTYLHCMDIVQKMGKVLKKVYQCPKVGVEIVGFEVPHVHIHVIPFYKMEDMDHTSAKTVEFTTLQPVAEKIRTTIKEEGV
ncbi:MAG: HIT family protein [Candidatus Saccharibacteria bacterium]